MSMLAQMFGHVVAGMVMLTTLLWMGLVPANTLIRVAEFLLAWSVLSTLVVALAGAWVALGRSRRPVSTRRFASRR
jgi:putative effector of murein hydrolase LrgA (UPF0299 family)